MSQKVLRALFQIGSQNNSGYGIKIQRDDNFVRTLNKLLRCGSILAGIKCVTFKKLLAEIFYGYSKIRTESGKKFSDSEALS